LISQIIYMILRVAGGKL